MDITARAMSQHFTHNPSHACPPSVSADPSSFCLFALCPLSQGLFLPLSSCMDRDTQHLQGTRKGISTGCRTAHWKQTATAKETALALTHLASNSESKAVKLALNHLGLLELIGRKRKAEREKEKRKRMR